jgi:hypothetical protein
MIGRAAEPGEESGGFQAERQSLRRARLDLVVGSLLERFGVWDLLRVGAEVPVVHVLRGLAGVISRPGGAGAVTHQKHIEVHLHEGKPQPNTQLYIHTTKDLWNTPKHISLL